MTRAAYHARPCVSLRSLRSGGAGWIAAIVLSPLLLVCNVLGGTSLLAHHHHGHGLHLHLSRSMVAAEVEAAEHLASHAKGECSLRRGEAHRHDGASTRASAQDRPGADQTPIGVRLSLPDHDQLSRRQAITDFLFVASPFWTLAIITDTRRGHALGDDRLLDQPPRIAPGRARDRLMRTSCALLL